MKRNVISLGVLAAGLFSAGTVAADHNSPMGEGWANMPNDIHNTRIDTMGDNETFREFVREGGGADSVNRYNDDTRAPSRTFDRTPASRGMARGGRR